MRKNKKIRLLAVGTAAVMCLMSTPLAVFGAEETKSYAGDLRWDFTTDSEGFNVSSSLEVEGVSDGVLLLKRVGDDPQMTIGTAVDSGEYRYLRYKINNPDKLLRFRSFIITTQPSWRAFGVQEDSVSGQTEYEIDLQGRTGINSIPNFTDVDVYESFRVDPIAKAKDDVLELDYIILSNKPASQKNSLITDIKIDGESVAGFKSNGDYFETSIYNDVYDKLSESTVDSVVKATTLTGDDVSVKVKNITDRKVIDVTAVAEDGSFADTYRIVCKGIRRPAEPTEFDVDKCDVSGKSVYVSGKLDSEDSRSVSIIAKEKLSGNILYIGKFRSNDNGDFEKSFMIYDDETSARLETVEIILDADGAPQPTVKEVDYVNNTKLNESAEELKSQTAKGVVEYMSDNKVIYSAAGVWCDLYDSLSSSQKDDINTAANKYKSIITAENAAEIANGSIAAVLAKTYNSNDFASLTEKFDKNVKKISVEGSSFSELDLSSKVRITAALKAEYSNGFESYKDFEAAVRENMLLDIVKTTTYTSMKNLLLRNVDILNDDLSELESAESEVSEDAMRIVTESARKGDFKTAKALVSAVKDAIKDAEKETDKSESLGGSHGGGSGGGSSYKTELPKKDAPASDVQPSDKSFKDLLGYEWAENAINTLFKKGIVNGVSDEIFEPSREVTREEFVKLMCETFGIEKSDEVSGFEDVLKSDWFAPYVSAAVKSGIINGVSDVKFGSGEKISREDMAVILYRAARNKFGLVSSNASMDKFTDAFDISDYATEAVAEFADMGIIKGNENGNFEPKSAASRAEAAVVIKRCMDKWATNY